MADSTTEHETEPVALDKAAPDATATETEVVDAGTTDVDNAESISEVDDGATAGKAKRKRGRRARRAAARAAQSAGPGAGTDDATDAVSADPASTEVEPTDTASTEADPKKVGRRSRAGKASKAEKLSKAGAGSKAGANSKAAAVAAGDRTGSRFLDARRLGRVIAGLLVVAVLLAALLLIQLIKGPGNWKKLEAQEDRREDARQAAASQLPRLYSFDYRQIDANIKEQLNLTVGAIHDQIQSSTAPALQALAPKTKVVVQAVAVDSAVLSDDAQSVQVIVFLNQATTNNLLPAPRLDRNRLIATMQSVNGQWKIADVRAV